LVLQPGARLGPYEILSALGAGGMGDVWKARDTRLDRIVAIKQLKGEHSARFAQEARAIAALNHPHICTLYDIGPDYLVMEHIDGAPLRGPLPAEVAVPLAIQIAGALVAAHQKGILHRDLKPANVLVVDGSAKLLDFGLAKTIAGSADMTQTIEGTVSGTVAYMSPEQAQGRPLDERSDIFSFGAVLHEVISGDRAFAGTSSAEVVSAVLRDEPRPLQASEALARIVTRCLRKLPADRFQRMVDVKAALEQFAIGSPADARASIAVLPFADMSPGKDNEYFSDGLAEEIINALAQMPGLRVIARTSAFAFKGQNTDIRGIAAALGVSHVLEGSVRKAGDRIRVTAQLIQAADGSHLWSQRYDRELADVFEVQDDIATAIAGALEAKLAARTAPRRQPTPSMPAYEAYLKGRHYQWKITPESLGRSQKYFEDAIAADPGFALAHSGLGMSFFMQAMFNLMSGQDAMPRVRDCAQRALALDASLPQAHCMLGIVAGLYDYDWREAERRFAIAMSRDPVPPAVRSCYGVFYLMYMGRFRAAIGELDLALHDDPLSVEQRYLLGVALLQAGRIDEGIARLHGALELDDAFMPPYVVLAFMATREARFADALAHAERAYALGSFDPVVVGVLAAALVNAGDHGRAQHILAPLEESSAPGTSLGLGIFHLLCGDVERAADSMTRAIEERYPGILFFLNSQTGAALRASARWPKLRQMLNLPDVAG
jgi:eukaryotic-like serine/threonine-protein kinase